MSSIPKPNLPAWLAAACATLLAAGWSHAELLTIDSAAEWQTWQIPQGLVQINEAGHLELVEYRKEINAVLDAHLFTHPTQKRGEVSGGIWRVASRPETAERIIDGDGETFWQPDLEDPLPKWEVEIDLGRVVLAREIRLTFPDREGARPFQQFEIQIATGARIDALDDIFKFDRVFQTTRPNRETQIRIQLGGSRDTTRVVDAGLDIDLEVEGRYRAVQFIRFKANEQNEGDALAEVGAIGVGDNVSIGTLARGGSFENGLVARNPQNMFDGAMDSNGGIFIQGNETGTWQEVGMWWQVDLGALFWIDGIFIYWKDRGEALAGPDDSYNAGYGHAILFSDGRQTTAGDIDFDPLIVEPMPKNSLEQSLRHFRYLFKPRKIRYLLWHGFVRDYWYTHPMEFMLFSPGYPAQVVLRSGFIDLGEVIGDGRSKTIKNLSWDAELPPNTRMQMRSRSGNSLKEEYTFYDKKGDVITEEKWLGSPKVIRGPVDTTVVESDDWSGWSNVYQFSGEHFKSQSPRRFIQLEVLLSSEDPQVAPVLRSLSIEFEDALVQEVRGSVLPRQARPNEDTHFTYTLWSQSDDLDSGFDLLRFTLPEAVNLASVSVEVDGTTLTPTTSMQEDSLLITLPQIVMGDSLQVGFTTRVLENATLFALDLGSSAHPGLWQSVEAVERRSNIVMLPELTSRRRLIGDLQISPSIFTPNGDDINDQLDIRFVAFKVSQTAPTVTIYDLAGRLVAELASATAGSQQLFTWTGQDNTGQLVQPGLYLCRIDLGAESGEDVALRAITVAY